MSIVRSSILVLLSAAVLGACRTHKNPVHTGPATDARWAQVDSLAGIGQYATALELSGTIRSEALAEGDWRTEFKAWMHVLRFRAYAGGDMQEGLRELEQRAAEAPIPLQQVLYSVAAEQWWNHYQQRRWQVLERTEMSTAAGPDAETLTQGQYMSHILGLYQRSMQELDTLRRIPSSELGELLIDDGTARASRPSLFDVLAHRALEVLSNPETRLTEPTWRFQLEGATPFTLFEPWILRPLAHRDSSSWLFQALRIHQQLERTHLNRDPIDGLVDATLDRLTFVHTNSSAPDRDSLLLGALDELRSRLPNDSSWSMVTARIAQWHADQAASYDRSAGDAWKWEKRTARTMCMQAMERWPASRGARHAAILKQTLEQPVLVAEAEQAVVPGMPNTIALRYANLRRVWVRVVDDAWVKDAPWVDEAEVWSALLARTPRLAWSVDLPDDGDLQEHVVDLPMEGLPAGRYTVLLSAAESFGGEAAPRARITLWSTAMALVQRQRAGADELLVLDRWSGMPRSNVKATAYTIDPYQRDAAGAQVVGEFVTDNEGRVRAELQQTRGQLYWELRDGGDHFVTDVQWRHGGSFVRMEVADRLFLFTDRAIYRPGQQLFFKGILVHQEGGRSTIRANERVELRLFNVNGEEVAMKPLVTDAYGSVSGTFDLPVGGLTGGMRLEAGPLGSHYFHVEEYKRPTFEVLMDPVEGTPALGGTATVTGKARSYAGVPLDGAQVRWTVKRGARMPWWCGGPWRGLPWGQETAMASGSAVCDATGTFSLSFPLVPDAAFPRDADPTFTYSVEVDVVDIAGETQQGSTAFTVGYRSIDIRIDGPDVVDRARTTSLSVQVTNLQGQPVDLPMEVRIVELQPPADAPVRECVLTRADRALDGTSVGPDASDVGTWAEGRVVLERRAFKADAKGLVLAGVPDWTVGVYRMEVSAADANGRTVKVTKHLMIIDDAIQNTGFLDKAFHVHALQERCEPGTKARLLLSSALPQCRVLMEVERKGLIVASRSLLLRRGQQLVELPVMEDDRGGFAVHFVSVERGREHRTTLPITVPWSNKQLQVEWQSFRDKLLPGAKEEWRLRIRGPRKEQVAAQVLSVLYDASLDRFAPHEWRMDIWSDNPVELGWNNASPFGPVTGGGWWQPMGAVALAPYNPPYLNTFGMEVLGGGRGYQMRGGEMLAMADASVPGRNVPVPPDAVPKAEEPAEAQGPKASQAPGAVIRSDFRETAFFLPEQLTDRDGTIVLRFTMPDALTRWNFMGLAHTKDLQLAHIARSTVTQKPLMVVPNLPRTLRQGDRITLTAKVNVLEGGARSGTATLELFDPRTNSPMGQAFALTRPSVAFKAGPGASATVRWNVTVPDGADAVAVRITARSAGASDGEERVLPVLTDRILVTESLPITLTKPGTRRFVLEKLKATRSSTLQHRSLSLEFTPNPAWYAIQAMPYLMEYPHACAEQTFSRFYANALSADIVRKRPAVAEVFAAWSKGKAGEESAFLSALEKNPELRSVVLEETPWVLDAKDQAERKRRIALFFDLQRMARERSEALAQLRAMQLPNGAWPWWSGMQASRYITQHIVGGMGHLEVLGALPEGEEAKAMVQLAVQWLDREVAEEFERMKRAVKNDSLPRPSALDVHYAYVRSQFTQWPMERGAGTVGAWLVEQLSTHWLSFGLQEQAMIAIALERLGGGQVPKLITTSLQQRATVDEELGMYWKGLEAGVVWTSFPTETHALMIEAFDRVAHDGDAVNALRQHLLTLKRTTDWGTTKATAEACYALLLTGPDLLSSTTMPVITVGAVAVDPDRKEAGTGYFQQQWSGSEVRPAMAEVSVTTASSGVQWGALHWQYLEQMDKVTAHASPFAMTKQVMLRETTDAGERLVPVTEARSLRPGDRLTVRLELRTDRWLDHVHLKDLRASGLEPVDVLSGTRWQGGLAYYQSIRDAGMHFFFDRIAPGTYVFTYDLRVTHAGEFSNGITTAMCMYAPEFATHSAGGRVSVQE